MPVTNNFIPSENSESPSPCDYVCHMLTALLSICKLCLYSTIL